MVSLSSTVFPNPDTYLNHLSPRESIEYETTRNVLLVLLGVSFPSIMSSLLNALKGYGLGYTCQFPRRYKSFEA
jgi:hypothetical protein